MLRRFARINSVPNYPVDYDKETKETTETKENETNPQNKTLSKYIPPHLEYQYLNLIHDIFTENHEHISRNGTTFSVFGTGMVFSLEQGIIPILTTKKMAWKTCLKELLWFIQGHTDNHILNDADVHI